MASFMKPIIALCLITIVVSGTSLSMQMIHNHTLLHKTIDSVIDTAVCLNGRLSEVRAEIGDNMVEYCFDGYDENDRPIYRGQNAEIRWTDTAGDYGDAYGIFELDSTDGYPIAYCLHGDDMDLSVCSKEWFVNDHGSFAYHKDKEMEMVECECSDTDLMGSSLLAMIETLKDDISTMQQNQIEQVKKIEDKLSPFEDAMTSIQETKDGLASIVATVELIQNKQKEYVDSMASIKETLEIIQSKQEEDKKGLMAMIQIMQDAYEKNQETKVIGQSDMSVEEWLNSFGLSQYYSLFKQNGYDSFESIVKIDGQKELVEIGVTSKADRARLLKQIGKLNNEM